MKAVDKLAGLYRNWNRCFLGRFGSGWRKARKAAQSKAKVFYGGKSSFGFMGILILDNGVFDFAGVTERPFDQFVIVDNLGANNGQGFVVNFFVFVVDGLFFYFFLIKSVPDLANK